MKLNNSGQTLVEYVLIIALSIAIGELGDKTFLSSIGLGIQYPNSKIYLIIGAILGMLQEKFIVSQISLDQLEYHNIISEYTENNPYLPIKFFHYLVPQLLCKYNNLTKKLDWENYLYPPIPKDESSQSSSSFASITTRQITESIQQPFYEYYINYINQDLNEFIEDTNKFFTDNFLFLKSISKFYYAIRHHDDQQMNRSMTKF